MKDHNSTLRDYKKIQIQSLSISRNSFDQQLTRKESTNSNIIESFKYGYLPRLPAREQAYRRVNISSEIKKMPERDQSNFFTAASNKQTVNSIKFKFDSSSIKKFAVCSKQGKRKYHEDRYICKTNSPSIYSTSFTNKDTYDIYAIFDGHGGSNCSEFLKDNFGVFLSRNKLLTTNPEQALKETFQKCEQKFLQLCEAQQEKERSGSCAVVCLVLNGRVITANLGDSRAIMINKESVLQLTRDHKPSDLGQKMRIIMHGGKIYKEQDGSHQQIKIFSHYRILPGNLNVSRTIGDIEVKLKKYGGLPGMISPTPDILAFDKCNYDILLMGSDGLFQAFSSEQVRQLYSRLLEEHEQLGKEKLLGMLVECLCEQGVGRSSDNVTVIGVLLI